jgi:TPR repeat protein
MLKTGVDCDFNAAEAARWFRKASRQGHKGAQATLMAKRLNSKLSAHGDETEDLTEEEDDY